MVDFAAQTVPLDQLLLDPNNFRLNSPSNAKPVAEERFKEESVQKATLERIQKEGVKELKDSIRENGFVPVERVVVRKLDSTVSDMLDEDLYVVIEGNRRTAALKYLRREHEGGANLPEQVIDTFNAVPVLLASNASDDDQLAIMGIRHVGGPKEWGGYQSALLVHILSAEHGLSSREVASRLGLSVQEVNRRLRAFSALRQMMDDEEYGDQVTAEMYPIFHETVGQPNVREWLGWEQDQGKFTDQNNTMLFYSWLTETNEYGEVKIDSYKDIRQLKVILDNEDALTALKDDQQSLSEALEIAHAHAKASRWLPNAKAALKSLNEMSTDTIEGLEDSDLELLRKLQTKASWIVQANQLS